MISATSCIVERGSKKLWRSRTGMGYRFSVVLVVGLFLHRGILSSVKLLIRTITLVALHSHFVEKKSRPEEESTRFRQLRTRDVVQTEGNDVTTSFKPIPDPPYTEGISVPPFERELPEGPMLRAN
ncbi:hypothetical protein HOY82DRAFT_614728 [Tuber indicum]|nr:hypothetical protein HOY82DRAFT_614728 [Tuber indicum]